MKKNFLKIIFLIKILTKITSQVENPSSIQIIGVLAYNVSEKARKRSNFKKGTTYIYSSYYKFLEYNNLKWMPISVNLPEKDFISKLEKINGIILPGGGEPILNDDMSETIFFKKIKIMIDFSKKMKERNINFPILGTCLGFEGLLTVLTNKTNILKKFKNENSSEKLKIQLKGFNSFLRPSFSEKEISEFNKNEFFYFHHIHAFFKEDIESNEIFQKDLDVLAYLEKKNNEQNILAIFQHKTLPIIAWQFHPEKVLFDTNEKQKISKTEKSLFLNSKFYKIIKNFVLGQNAKISDEELMKEKSNLAMTFNYGYPIKQECILLPPIGLDKNEIIDDIDQDF